MFFTFVDILLCELFIRYYDFLCTQIIELVFIVVKRKS